MIIHVKRAAQIVRNRISFGSNDISEDQTVALYFVIKQLFRWKTFRINIKKMFMKILWKVVLNTITKHKGKFVNEINAIIQ